ncbi:hypothetical protein CYMTET_27966 [Cymbomonas tetramitiformis]|uniref:Ion transport domain-containing protein n=1 Tax=Cymbomonas tetramitiformis TaxID=36881 RepID=A0AAE0FNQ2_9CHLO|nr:hypothetical protein CYMTET_27966 [Cymbomonas tetramitiformis]
MQGPCQEIQQEIASGPLLQCCERLLSGMVYPLLGDMEISDSSPTSVWDISTDTEVVSRSTLKAVCMRCIRDMLEGAEHKSPAWHLVLATINVQRLVQESCTLQDAMIPMFYESTTVRSALQKELVEVHILLATLMTLDIENVYGLSDELKAATSLSALKYHKRRIRHVEALHNDNVYTVPFHLSDDAAHFRWDKFKTDEYLKELYSVERSNPQEKAENIMAVIDRLLFMMHSESKLIKRMKYFRFARKNYTLCLGSSLRMSVVICLILTFNYGKDHSDWKSTYASQVLPSLALVAGLRAPWAPHLRSCSWRLSAGTRQFNPLTSRHEEEHMDAPNKKLRATKLVFEQSSTLQLEPLGPNLNSFVELALAGFPVVKEVFASRRFSWYLFLGTSSVIGTLYSNFFFAAHLLDYMVNNPDGRMTMEAVIMGGSLLVKTALVTLIIIFMYTIVSFKNFRDRIVDNYECETFFQCSIYHLVFGMDGAGKSEGIGSLFGIWYDPPVSLEAREDWEDVAHIMYLMSFVIVWMFLLSNIITGQIVDAFGSVRDIAANKKRDLEENSLICSIDRYSFGGHFQTHMEEEQNPLDYLFFVQYILEMDPANLGGIHSHIYACLKEGRVTDWIPVSRSVYLESTSSLQKEHTDQIEAKVIAATTTRVDSLERNMKRQYEFLSQDMIQQMRTIEQSSKDRLDRIEDALNLLVEDHEARQPRFSQLK